MKIAFLYNLRADHPAGLDDAELVAEWDEPATAQEVIASLREAGHHVLDVGDPGWLLREQREPVDLVFSICEMSGFRHREALVPALCEVLGLPYVFSPPDVMVAALDKNITNLLVRQAGGNVPDWTVARAAESVLPDWTEGRCIVKPVAEGSGMGVSGAAVTETASELRVRIDDILGRFGQPVIVQRYAPGREFTVGVVERDGQLEPLAAIEVTDTSGETPIVYGLAEKEDAERRIVWSPVREAVVKQDAERLAVEACEALGCRDAARVDLRIDAQGHVAFLELNTLPHLHPVIGDFCRSAKAAQWTHPRLLDTIVQSAGRRQSFR